MRRIVAMTLIAAVACTARASDQEDCAVAASVDVPATDVPDAATRAQLSGCDSEALYYGIGVEADPVRARQCALVEREAGDEAPFGGTSILLLVYANGRGAARNLDLATRFACELGGAPAETESRLEHLRRMRADAAETMDVCDDATSGLSAGYCASHEERIHEVERTRRNDAALARLPPERRALVDSARAAAEAFFDAREESEVDLSGTARAAFQIDERASLEEALVGDLELLSRAAPPEVAAGATPESADTELNRRYRRALRADPLGTITKDGIRDTERAWLRYRDAWSALAQAVAPETATAWTTHLTTRRAAQLALLADE
jgi:hypothetical protein